ncbi:MAG: hypothetical protein E7222_09650 [Clostridiales bacterium]|nr:hypothetical protein [Clostridiales bacterium]
MDDIEEFYGTAYNEHLQDISEENEKRNDEILELKGNLLKPVITTDKTKISAHIKALKQEMKNDTTYENRAIYEEVLRLLQRLQVA